MRKHKNIAVLLDSLSTLSSSYPDLKLVVCGEKGHSYPNLLNKIRALGLAEKVIFLEGISDEALRDLYCAAVGLVLPSYYEGFGLPPLEAMSCGTPVIVANSPALMEIAGEGACSFNASDPAALSRHLRELLEKEAVRQEFSRRSLRRAQEFTWDRAASQILEMYGKLSDTKRTVFRARSVEAHGNGRTQEKNRLARFEAFDLGNIERGAVSTLRFHEPSESPKASVIIPTLDGDRNGNLSRLLQDLCRQTYDSFEVHLVKGVKPQGKAINAGAEKSEAPLLIILDDDSTVPNANTFSNLCDVVQSDARVGMAGASVVISPESNYFQQRAAKQFPRFNMPIAEKVLESDMASHGCCVIPRSLFYEIGKEKETIFRGLDPDLRERLRRAGYKTVLVPQTWVYHPLSPTFIKLMRQFYRNGIGSAHAWLVDPKTVFQTHEKADLEGFVPRRSFLYRVARFPLRLLHALVTLRVIRCAAYTSYALGFVYGLLKYSLVKKATA